MAERQDTVNFNAHLSSIVNKDLVDRSNIAASNSSWFLKIVFPDIPELNGVKLVVPFSNKEWPHYVYDEIFSYIKAKYPEITSPSFNGDSYRLQIYVEGQDVEVADQETKSTDLPNGATVELRYHRGLIGPVLGREEVGAAPVHPLRDFHGHDDWDDDWDDNWDPAAPALAAPALAAPAADAMAAHADAAAAAPADPFPPIRHSASNTMMTYDHKQHRYLEPILNGVSGKWMIYDPANEWYSEPLAPWSGGPGVPGTAMQGPPPTIYPGQGGKKPQSKRGKKKQKSKSKSKKSKSKKSKTKKSKSKSKRNKRRSYKRVN